MKDILFYTNVYKIVEKILDLEIKYLTWEHATTNTFYVSENVNYWDCKYITSWKDSWYWNKYLKIHDLEIKYLTWEHAML